MIIHLPGLKVPVTIALALLITFQSCKKNDLRSPSGEITDTENIAMLREAIAISAGTSLDKVIYLDKEKQFMIGGDGYVTLQDAQLRFGNKGNGCPGAANAATQMMSHFSVDTSKVCRIKVFADASVPADWLASLDLAIDHWNQTGSKAHMERVASSTPYNTVVTTTYAVSSSIASAAYPDYYGNPGNKITINTYHNGLAATRKEFALTHELGHTLGFSHTNETNGYLVKGTPTSDPASVMNSVIADWNGFSRYDVKAVRTVYPADKGGGKGK